MGHFFKTIILALPAVMAVLSCSKQDVGVIPDNQTDVAYLKINSVSTSEPVKSVINGTTFPADEEVSIGLFLTGEGYTGSYDNVKYTRVAGGSEWVTDKEIKLDDKTATVYAYYPYNASVTKIDEIKVTSSFDGTDFMWATPVGDINAAKPNIDLTFHHALALVEIIFNISGFDQESAKLTYLKIESTSDGFASWRTLNATNGILSSGEVNDLETYKEYSISDGRIVVPCLLVPVSTGTDAKQPRDFTVTCTFNGKSLNTTLIGEKGAVIRQNTKSTISLNIKNGDS